MHLVDDEPLIYSFLMNSFSSQKIQKINKIVTACKLRRCRDVFLFIFYLQNFGLSVT